MANRISKQINVNFLFQLYVTVFSSAQNKLQRKSGEVISELVREYSKNEIPDASSPRDLRFV